MGIALLGWAFCAAGCDAELYHDLSERRANEALLALREAGFRAEKQIEQRGTGGRSSRFVLIVPRGEEAQALRLLEQRGLPRLPEWAAPQTSQLLRSPLEEHTESAAALSARLADTLERLPEVAEARVHLALPDAEPLSPLGSPRPTASVLLRLRAPLSVKPSEVAELLARAVPGLDPQDVAVVRASFQAGLEGAAHREPPALVSVGPLLLAPESRPVALFLFGVVALLSAVLVLLLRLVWPTRASQSK